MAVAGQVEELKDDIGADTELLDQVSLYPRYIAYTFFSKVDFCS
jgi:hypothetical protein